MPTKSIKRASLAGAALLAGALAAAAPAAGGQAPETAAKPTKLVAKENQRGFAFKPDDPSVRSGGELALKNRTSEEHTFSVVKRRDLPETGREMQRCFREGNICRRLFEAHDEGTTQLVDRHKKGFDRPIDSIIFDDPTTVDVSAGANRRLHFICAIHPEMQGALDVR